MITKSNELIWFISRRGHSVSGQPDDLIICNSIGLEHTEIMFELGELLVVKKIVNSLRLFLDISSREMTLASESYKNRNGKPQKKPF